MVGFIFKRVLSAIPLIIGFLTVTFFIVHLAPGDPTTLYVQPDTDPMYALKLRHSLGLDESLPFQFVKWSKSMLEGDFGVSFSKHAPVAEILSEAIPNTLLLTSFALSFNFLIGICIGVYAAIRRGTFSDYFINMISLFVYSMPEFWLGLMLILGFSEGIPIFPASGMYSPLANYLSTPLFVWDVAQHMILPVFVLGFASAAATGRYMRGSMLEVIHQDYIRTARAKGLSESLVIGKHALRNALIPIITLFSLSLPFLLGGAVIVETVFGWPGMGKVTIDAIFTRDYPLIIACTFVSGVMVVFGNLLADVLYAIIDPRIRVR